MIKTTIKKRDFYSFMVYFIGIWGSTIAEDTNHFAEDTSLYGLKFTTNIVFNYNTSKLRCAHTCMNQAVCKSWIFSGTQCTGYDTIFETIIDGNPLSDARYYYSTERPTIFDCSDLKSMGSPSGIYKIYPENVPNGVSVYCDMDKDGGGWIVIQNRFNGSVDFYRNWNEYKEGFGDLNTEFWLGNSYIHLITKLDTYLLRFDLEDAAGNKGYAVYNKFKINDEDDDFRLTVSDYSGDLGENSHTASEKVLNAGQQFQTAQRKLLEKSEASVTAAMRNIYFMAQFNLSNHIFADFNKHCINQGCSDLIGLKVDKHTTYEHSNSIHDFQDAISTVIIEDIIKSVDNKPYSIMIDESTDISVDQNLLIYIRFLNQSLGKFEPKSCLLGVRKLRDGATADKITQEIFESLNDFNINISNMCGIATDGAAVMVGRHSGVVTRIKETVPGLLSSHCIAHRLALASGAAADSVQYLVKFQEIISSIYKYFSKSPKNMSRLDKIFDIVKKSECEAHATRFKQVFHTRWLSFDGSVSAICENFSSLLSVLSEDKGAKAQGILKSVSSYKFLHCSFFMSDILKDLSILCKAYQSSTIEYTVVHPLLSVTVDKINGHFENEDGFMFTKFLDDVPSVFDCEKFHFKGHDIRDSGKYRDEAKSACRNFVSNLLENLNKRFSFEGDSEVLSSMCNIFNPILYSNDCKDKFLKSAKQVVQHFSDCKLNDFDFK
ncbi:Fibrinogen C domain-containing protein 1-A,Fibrinogen C domain-containing protein 1,Fibrinogen C domain-containing protein 1-B,Angiopoietin-1,Fibrinogen-like protein A,Angiopoietin-4 [Mytilus edulis]|uniref:Fibrinogen C domain-containing protein 1-A,Fibrinogen C domain-containing protein 1,Fibrinogen C domain-containing protein 1-B,Angiopoietin-1,Fibrinogen-like protein A,Angiopoietin-4 n=1 Tax=Mytilus edulis TaxID=6550 RepID=A0A8S3QAW1_MYTED|nr:Fibrinogen C domain-containing protein 1-A,Fibrinogen C domain-containing protein 1,Fibrinogen C domain-containing protein 1-B,Angiopoietin-1,Fibrinogen-like protein A,Angiopoietin-4 [Mytilus edulis]